MSKEVDNKKGYTKLGISNIQVMFEVKTNIGVGTH